MKITPIPNASSAGAGAEGLRTLTMNVNRTPQPEQMPELQTPVAKPEETKENVPRLESEAEATQPISHQFAQLRKAQRAVQVKEAELKAREQELAGKFNDKDFIPVSQLKQQALKTLLGAGVTYDQLREELTSGQVNPEISRLENEIKALKEGVDSKFTESVEAQKKQILATMRQEGVQMIASGDEFALVRETKSLPDVMRLVEETHAKTGRALTMKEALTMYEAELEKDAERILALDKVKSKFAPQPAPLPQRPSGMRTLTNKDTASPPLDRRARALAAFYGRPT